MPGTQPTNAYNSMNSAVKSNVHDIETLTKEETVDECDKNTIECKCFVVINISEQNNNNY